MAWTEHDVVRSELRWAAAVIGFVAILFALTLVAALALHRNPPSNAERIDPKTPHLSGEFTEPDLGTRARGAARPPKPRPPRGGGNSASRSIQRSAASRRARSSAGCVSAWKMAM